MSTSTHPYTARLKILAGQNRTGTHAEWGTETAAALLQIEAGHDRNHLVQIEQMLQPVS